MIGWSGRAAGVPHSRNDPGWPNYEGDVRSRDQRAGAAQVVRQPSAARPRRATPGGRRSGIGARGEGVEGRRRRGPQALYLARLDGPPETGLRPRPPTAANHRQTRRRRWRLPRKCRFVADAWRRRLELASSRDDAPRPRLAATATRRSSRRRHSISLPLCRHSGTVDATALHGQKPH